MSGGKKISKLPFVGTLNLCLKTPDTMQKTRMIRSSWAEKAFKGKTKINHVFYAKFSMIIIFAMEGPLRVNNVIFFKSESLKLMQIQT